MTNKEQTIEKIQELIHQKGHILVGIDGRCASGKTTFALQLQKELGGTVISMDDFFLRPEQRTASRYETPGENVDHERFLEEVLLPLKNGVPVIYRPFDCSTMSLQDPIEVPEAEVTLIEGSYAFHPDLREYYDLKIFMTVEPEIQMQRIQERNPSAAENFRKKWIPLEERYFQACAVEKASDIILDTTQSFNDSAFILDRSKL